VQLNKIIRLVASLIIVLTIYSSGQASEDEKTVLVSILARNKAHLLDKYLQCIENLEYDKSLMSIYINTNNNDDNTEQILAEWAEKNQDNYQCMIFDSHHVEGLESGRPHDWTSDRFKILGEIRNQSLQIAKQLNYDYYFVVDCDNFITPCTLKVLISKDKPIIAPMLLAVPESGDYYSNFFGEIDNAGYYQDHPDYVKILCRTMLGTFKVPVVHCTYLINSEYLDDLNYIDESNHHEFIIFSRIARNRGIDQYICNEYDFGYLLHFYQNLSLEEEKTRWQAFEALEDTDDAIFEK